MVLVDHHAVDVLPDLALVAGDHELVVVAEPADTARRVLLLLRRIALAAAPLRLCVSGERKDVKRERKIWVRKD